MKVGILTYHAACNFGANLQALSTVEYFRNSGDEVRLINFYPDELEQYYLKRSPEVQYEEHRCFREEHLPLTRRCRDEHEVAEVIEEEKIEAVIIGSDAVMQHHPLRSRIIFPCSRIISVYQPTNDRMCPNPFWGSFVPLLRKPIPVCYMSASSQNSAFQMATAKERKTMRECLERFAYISVRDDWSARMVTSITDGRVAPDITPDPVFAFNHNVRKQISEKEIKIKFHLPERYFLLSFLNNETVSVDWLSQFKELANKNGIECVAMPFPNGVHYKHPFEHELTLPLSPLEWYALIKYSAGYVGHNMHPIVVSLHNAVPCFSFDQYGIVKYRLFTNEKSSKIYHIMNRFGVIQNRFSDIGAFRKAPSAEMVYDRLMSFDKELVRKNAAEYLDEYLVMMGKIENHIR